MLELGDPLLLGSQGFREYLVPILLRWEAGCVEGVVLLDEERLQLSQQMSLQVCVEFRSR
jgi:hypothetical protein